MATTKREIQRKKRMSEDEGYKQKRVMQKKVSDAKLAKTPKRIQYLKEFRKKRMSEDEGYKKKRAMQKKVSDTKLAKTPERIQYLKETLEARNKPISKILALTLDALPAHLKVSLIGIFKKILLAPWGSESGIPIHTDAPGSCSAISSLTRKDVTNIHFGQRCGEDEMCQGEYEYRTDCCPETGCDGIDPRHAEIRLMSASMVELGEAVRRYLIENKMRCSSNMDLENEFNSVTALLHMGKDAMPGSEGSSIEYHCDSIFGTDGVFSPTQNTQKQHTPVVVVTLGDPRTLKMKKRRVTDGTWRDDTNYGALEFFLTNGTFFVFHPDDEQPKRRATQKFLSQYQHGNVHVTEGLSLSLVYRVVTSKAKVHVADNRKELQDKDKVWLANKVCHHTRQSKTAAKDHDDAHKQFLEEKQRLEAHFGKFVRGKIEKWGWLAPAPGNPAATAAAPTTSNSRAKPAAIALAVRATNLAAIAPARAIPATIAPAPTTANHKVETEETKMVCKVIKRGQDGEEDKSIGFIVLKSRTKSFVDARQAIVDQGVPINMGYMFSVPHLGPIAVKQESLLGPMLAFLETCAPQADLGDGSFANPVKVFLVKALAK